MAQAQIHIRMHRGAYDESMRSVTLIDATQAAVQRHIDTHPTFADARTISGTRDAPVVKKYGRHLDPRNGWDTHIILVDGTPWGFTSGPLEEPTT